MVTVGRDAHANVVVGSAGVSTYHLLFEREKGSDDWYVRDRGSKNGTLLGGRALPPGQPMRVPPRCWMQIGATGLEVFGRRPLQRLTESRIQYVAMLARSLENDPVILVQVAGGVREDKLFVRQRPYRLGRSNFCEIHLDEVPGEEEEPASLAVSAEGVRVTNTGQRLPVFVGRATLAPGESCVWNPRDMMGVGTRVFALWRIAHDAVEEYRATELE